MSELAKSSREANKAKAKRLATADPHQKVDGSSWTPSEPMDADVQTGPRPVSRQQRRHGGKVQGEHAQVRADRAPRKAGGRAAWADEYINRDVKEANEEREGKKHVGGMKSGGRAKKADGGSFVPTDRFQFSSGPSRLSKMAGLKTGGAAKHSDEAQDKALIRAEVKPAALKRPGKRLGGDLGFISPALMAADALRDKDGKKRGGSVAAEEGTRPKGGREARKDGGKLTAKQRNAEPKSDFGLPGERKYPMPDKSHAANAKARASQMEKRGKLSEGAKAKIDAKADKVLARKDGGRAGKGKMNVNIVIATGKDQAQPLAPMPAPMPKPMPPMAGPPPGAGAPPPMPPPGAGGPPMGAPALPPMPRKRGGRAYFAKDGGAGSGLGRLEKIGEA